MKETEKRFKPRRSNKDKKKVSALTLCWLDENFYVCDGACLPRCILYSHYLDYCNKQSVHPACAATFGKLIRQKFPEISTRRLGTRGHSKYHYYGVGIKETSCYYETLYSTTGLTRFSGCKFTNEGGFTRKYSLSCKLGITLSDFPTAQHLVHHKYYNQIETLALMYKTHCQCILDSVVAENFQEVHSYLVHFWQGLPEHLVPLISYNEVRYLIAACDLCLYNHLIDVLVPVTMQEMPTQLLRDVHHLARCWKTWIHEAMYNFPDSSLKTRLDCAHRFQEILSRQISFLDLAQSVRPVLYDTSLINQIISEVDSLKSNISQDSLSRELLSEFKEILHKQATVESFIEWMDTLLDNKIVRNSSGDTAILNEITREFLTSWTNFGSDMLKQLVDSRSPFYSAISRIKQLLEEYIFIVVETHVHDDFQKTINSQMMEASYHSTTSLRDSLQPLSNPFPSSPGFSWSSETSNNQSPAYSLPSYQNYTPQKPDLLQNSTNDLYDRGSVAVQWLSPFTQPDIQMRSPCLYQNASMFYADHQAHNPSVQNEGPYYH